MQKVYWQETPKQRVCVSMMYDNVEDDDEEDDDDDGDDDDDDGDDDGDDEGDNVAADDVEDV